MYRLIISPRAQKELKKLKKEEELPVWLALEEIREDPSLGKPLTRELTKKFSHRFGVYRIIYKVNEKDKTVEIISAGHRSAIYN